MALRKLSLILALVAAAATESQAQVGPEGQGAIPRPDAAVAPLELAPGTLACRATLVRLWTSIPPWERATPWLADLFRRDEPVSLSVEARRRCIETLDEPLVRFDSDLPPTPPPVW